MRAPELRVATVAAVAASATAEYSVTKQVADGRTFESTDSATAVIGDDVAIVAILAVVDDFIATPGQRTILSTRIGAIIAVVVPIVAGFDSIHSNMTVSAHSLTTVICAVVTVVIVPIVTSLVTILVRLEISTTGAIAPTSSSTKANTAIEEVVVTIIAFFITEIAGT